MWKVEGYWSFTNNEKPNRSEKFITGYVYTQFKLIQSEYRFQNELKYKLNLCKFLFFGHYF